MDSVKISINEGWKFHYGECEEAFYKGYDDSNFKKVSLPHDWSVEMPFERTNSSGTGYLSGGTAWYRLHFKLPEEYRGRHIMLCFDGIYKNSHIWVNSYNMGKHPYGYTPIYVDITKFAFYGDTENVVAVRVAHEDIADSRWFTGSGITRKATLLVEDMLHPVIDGYYVETESLANGEAGFVVHEELENTADNAREAKICLELLDREGCTVWQAEEEVFLEAGEKRTLLTKGAVENVKPWSVDSPYLYTIRSSMITDLGKSMQYEEKTGFRTIAFDPDRGFFLNGENMKLKGVCLHHDAGALGAAVTKEVWQRRLELLKECGTNAIRCSHNPHMPELYELCDEMGFVMMDEAFDEWECPKNKWSTGHNVYPPKHQGYAEDFPEWHEKDLRAMVKRDRKYTSVIMWSIGNEIDYPNDPYCHPSFETMTGNNDANKPKAERMYDPNKPNAERMVELAGKLAAIVKTEDTGRPVTMALAFPELSAKLGIFKVLDMAGYNYKEHLYEQDHKDYPEVAFLGSENGQDYSQWKVVEDNPYISGQFLWTGFDYLGEAHGWPIHGSGAGVMDLAGFAKHRFFARKSYWCSEPMVKLATRYYTERDVNVEWIPMYPRWNYKTGEQVLVRIFSNMPEVSLLLNGREVAREKGYNANGYYQFEIPFEEGELKAVAWDTDGKPAVTDCIETSGNIAAIELTPWKKPDDADKGYIYQLILEAKDAEGRPVLHEDYDIAVNVMGDGLLMGLENGNLADNTPYFENVRKTAHGKLMVYVKKTGKGAIRLRCTHGNVETCYEI